MDKHVYKIKNKLTFIFTIIVFIIILFLWTIFFSFKYFKGINSEIKIFQNISNTIENRKNWLNEFLKFSNFSNFDINKRNIWKEKNKQIFSDINMTNKGFINYLIIVDNSITSFNIKDNISDSFLNYILKIDSFDTIKENDWFIIKNIKTKSWVLVLFKKIRYTFSDYISDIIIFTIINLIFSIILFFIWKKFVDKTFIPVEKNIKDMKDFVQNAGHELKTPISVIDSNIQIINEEKKYNPKMFKEIKQEVKKMNSLIDSLIKLSGIDNLEKVESVKLKSIIEEILDNMKSDINKKDLNIVVKITKDTEIRTSRNYLYIFLSNIIWNAIKYNKQKWKINISYKAWILIIKDTWIWIGKDNIIKIFDRFYKIDNSRNTKGFWIGLSLAKKIADIYKWKISVDSEEKKGSSFKIKM